MESLWEHSVPTIDVGTAEKGLQLRSRCLWHGQVAHDYLESHACVHHACAFVSRVSCPCLHMRHKSWGAVAVGKEMSSLKHVPEKQPSPTCCLDIHSQRGNVVIMQPLWALSMKYITKWTLWDRCCGIEVLRLQKWLPFVPTQHFDSSPHNSYDAEKLFIL